MHAGKRLPADLNNVFKRRMTKPHGSWHWVCGKSCQLCDVLIHSNEAKRTNELAKTYHADQSALGVTSAAMRLVDGERDFELNLILNWN